MTICTSICIRQVSCSLGFHRKLPIRTYYKLHCIFWSNSSFQEVVPLNANNVLCVENDCPAALWEAKIRKTLNKICGQPKSSGLVKCLSVPIPSPSNPIDVIVTDVPEVSDVDRLLAEVASPRFQGNSQSSPTSEESFVHTNKNPTNCKHSVAKLSLERYPSQNGASIAASSSPWNGFSTEHPHQYLRVASKQMVGLFIIVWIRSSLWRQVHNVQVSTVGCGLMNHLGNKVCVRWLKGSLILFEVDEIGFLRRVYRTWLDVTF